MRNIIGATDPRKAEKGTIRSDLGTSIQYNIVHASDGVNSAKKEIELWFRDLGLKFSTEKVPESVLLRIEKKNQNASKTAPGIPQSLWDLL